MTATTYTLSAHSQAPWLLDPVDLVAYRDKKSEPNMIASLEPRDSIEEWEANARLVAAAPELLDECWTQLTNWRMLRDGDWNGSPAGIQAAIKSLETVIARATGLDANQIPSRSEMD